MERRRCTGRQPARHAANATVIARRATAQARRLARHPSGSPVQGGGVLDLMSFAAPRVQPGNRTLHVSGRFVVARPVVAPGPLSRQNTPVWDASSSGGPAMPALHYHGTGLPEFMAAMSAVKVKNLGVKFPTATVHTTRQWNASFQSLICLTASLERNVLGRK